MTSPSAKSSVALIGAAAVLLSIIHLGGIAAQRESLQAALAASDAFTAAEHLKARESILIAQANTPGIDRDVRAGALSEAMRVRAGEVAGGGIDALETHHLNLREETQRAATRASTLALGETGLMLAILLLAVSEMLASVALRRGALALGGLGVLTALVGALGAGVLGL